MNALLALIALQTSSAAKEIGLIWDFPGKAIWADGHYNLVGKRFRGEVYCFTTTNGHFSAEALFQSDTKKTKEAEATKEFSQVKLLTTFAGMPALLTDQRYLWNGAQVASRCVYAAQSKKAWVVRLWWPRVNSAGGAMAEAFLKSCRRTPEPPIRLPNG